MRMRVLARVVKMVAATDGTAIAIARLLRDRFSDVAVSCVAASCVGPLVVASLSRRVAIIAGYFSHCMRFLGGRGGSERAPRVRPLDRPTDYLTDRRCARASLSWRSAKSTRGVLRPCETTKTAFPGSRAPARARHALCMSSGRRRRGCARPPCSDLRSNGSQFVSIHGRRIDDNHRDMTRRVRAPGWRSQAPTIRGRCA